MSKEQVSLPPIPPELIPTLPPALPVPLPPPIINNTRTTGTNTPISPTSENPQKRKAWKRVDFPRENKGKYYCLDCSNGSDHSMCTNHNKVRQAWRWCDPCKYYYSIKTFNKSHLHDDEKKKPHVRKAWKTNDFPSVCCGNYYCLDCKKGGSSPLCVEHGVARKLWKWCGKCGKYFSDTTFYRSGHSRHNTDQSRKRKVKYRAKWRRSDFPKINEGKFYCYECGKGSESSNCSLHGTPRKLWIWCEKCKEYISQRSYYRNQHNKHDLNSVKNRRKLKRMRVDTGTMCGPDDIERETKKRKLEEEEEKKK